MNVRAIAIQAGLFVCLLVAYLVVRPRAALEPTDRLLTFQMERIAKIEIARGGRSLVLERQKVGEVGSAQWVVATTYGYPLASDRIEEFVAPFEDAKQGQYVVSGLDESNWKDAETLRTYGLSEGERTVVRFYDGEGEVVEEVHLGNVVSRSVKGESGFLKREDEAPDMEMPKTEEEVHDTYVLVPKSGEVRQISGALRASTDPKDWLDRSIAALPEGERKNVERIQFTRKVDPKEGLLYEAEGKKYPVVRELAILSRVEKKDEKKEGEEDDPAGQDGFKWDLEVFYNLQLPEGMSREVPADGLETAKVYQADSVAVTALLDAVGRLEAEEFLEPVAYRQTQMGLEPVLERHFTDDFELAVVYSIKGSKDPRRFFFGRLPAPEPGEGEAEPPKGKPWCYAADTRSWTQEKEEASAGQPIPFQGGSEGDEGPTKVAYRKRGLFEIADWAFDSLKKEAFDFAKPEEGTFEEVPLTGVARDAVDRVRVVVPEKDGEKTVEKTFELDHEGADWLIASAHGYAADPAKVDAFLSSLFGAARSRIRARNPRLHKKFGLQSESRRQIVLLDAEGKELASIVLGKTDPFARIPGEDGKEETKATTYALDADGTTVREYVAEIDPKTKPEDWLEKKLVTIPKFRIDRFELEFDGRAHSFARQPDEQGEGSKWVVEEGGAQIEAKKEAVDRLLDSAVGLQLQSLAEPVAWPEGAEAPDPAGLAKYGLDHPEIVLFLHGREGIDESRVLAFAKKTEEPPKEEGEEHPEPAKIRHYVAVGAHLGKEGSTAQAFAGAGATRALAVYELSEWTAESFEKSPRDFFEIEALHALVRWKGAEGAPEAITRTQEEAKALAEKLSTEKTLEGGDSIEGFALPEEYWKAAYRLAPGEFSPAIETKSGYLVVERVK